MCVGGDGGPISLTPKLGQNGFSPRHPHPQFLTIIPDELAGLGFSEGGHLIRLVVATRMLEAAEGHTLAVDDTVRKLLGERHLGFLQRTL